ncbi:VTT domain-containing protein [Paenibacillus aceris]|uniref:Membrane protein DedA with SNARE-associated domain n=1 Tax=Paenibacillus aceris TaxID=869555 RepID=A0ABS4I058_9BACL|nr:VTT domain-containing protein [Paenibacillus aceris]MBP1964270.1 membrane protein DedA with SNARE-associated domain [Paenibacillus aceris]NHW36592.1 phosphatase PAP2 family protein [Paenibacillus aceris]
MGFLTSWLEHHGYWVLYFALFLEMLALPLPGEVLMSYTGLLIFQGKLNWFLCIVTAGAGVCTGVTLSYWIGFRLGAPFFEKYGARVHFGPDKLDKISYWFQKYGNKVLTIAYFIPGVRHFTGYFSGVTRISFRKYALFAYIGAFIWVSVFISLGKVLGPKWEQYHHTMNRYLIYAGMIAAVIFIMVYLFRKNELRMKELLSTILEKGITNFHSMGKVKFIVLAAFALFAVFLTLMIGLIQDFLENEFTLFDEVTSYIIHEVFDPSWSEWMNRFALLGSYYVFIPLIVITCLGILIKGKDRMLELISFTMVIVGGEALDEGLRAFFHRIGPSSSSYLFPYTFPSEQTLISLTVCGFAAYLLVRHHANLLARIAATLLVILLCLLVGISRIFFDVQYPSDVIAGYIFGGAWLSLNVILLEVLRMLRKNGYA